MLLIFSEFWLMWRRLTVVSKFGFIKAFPSWTPSQVKLFLSVYGGEQYKDIADRMFNKRVKGADLKNFIELMENDELEVALQTNYAIQEFEQVMWLKCVLELLQFTKSKKNEVKFYFLQLETGGSKFF